VYYSLLVQDLYFGETGISVVIIYKFTLNAFQDTYPITCQINWA